MQADVKCNNTVNKGMKRNGTLHSKKYTYYLLVNYKSLNVIQWAIHWIFAPFKAHQFHE